VEEAPVDRLFARPLHPYTRGLMAAIPGLGDTGGRRLTEIPGMVPSLREPIAGCGFATRCAHANERCRTEPPPFEEAERGHGVSCWNWRDAA
jgi:peptide/nickel transport system ATP-binding protein